MINSEFLQGLADQACAASEAARDAGDEASARMWCRVAMDYVKHAFAAQLREQEASCAQEFGRSTTLSCKRIAAGQLALSIRSSP